MAEPVSLQNNPIQAQMKTCYIMRGLPGSGKSSFAEKIVAKSPDAKIVSTDHYFSKNGVYQFKPAELASAHKITQTIAETYFGNNHPIVLIDNCNVTYEHMRPYIELALKNGYDIRLVEPPTKWKYDLKTCTDKTLHGVPQSHMENMQNQWISTAEVLKKIQAEMTRLKESVRQKRIANGN